MRAEEKGQVWAI
jgi:hypothetical protein